MHCLNQNCIVHTISLFFQSIIHTCFSKFLPHILPNSFFLTLFIRLHCVACEFPEQGLNLGLLHLKHEVLTPTPPEKSPPNSYLNVLNYSQNEFYVGLSKPVPKLVPHTVSYSLCLLKSSIIFCFFFFNMLKSDRIF